MKCHISDHVTEICSSNLFQDFIREQVLVMGAAGVYVWPVFLFLIIESTRSLPQSAIRELTELESQSKPIVFSIPSNVAAVDLFAGDFTSKSCLEHVSQKSMGKCEYPASLTSAAICKDTLTFLCSGSQRCCSCSHLI